MTAITPGHKVKLLALLGSVGFMVDLPEESRGMGENMADSYNKGTPKMIYNGTFV